jgi:Histidine kinase
MAWLAQTFRGLTWARFGVFCLFVAFIALHQPSTIRGLLKGATLAEMLLGPLRSFAFMFLVFTPVLLAVVAVENRGPRTGPARVASLIGALVVGHVIGAILWMNAYALLYPSGSLPTAARTWISDPVARLRSFGGRSLWFLVYSATATAVYYYLKKGRDAAAAMHREQLRREQMERENAEARLQVMQAQIEPHFLFNTLASVRRLYQVNRASGREMLQHLARYLTASLPDMRESNSTLARELALASAYLSVQKIRMESRLTFDIDVPSRLQDCLVPPMMIATLVENAVIHGLSPLPEGGHIRISARDRRGQLVIDVVDDGCGLHDSWGGGVGLSNIRARLGSEFGGNAQLTLSQRDDRGVRATLELPLSFAAQAKAA